MVTSLTKAKKLSEKRTIKMKRILSLVLACTLIIGCTFALASCFGAAPNEDPQAAVDALKAEGYEVRYDIDDEADHDRKIAEINATKMDLANITSAEDLMNAEIETISIQYFDTEDNAKAAYEELEAEFDDLLATSKQYYGDDFEAEIGISGKVVWIGTANAIKAAQ